MEIISNPTNINLDEKLEGLVIRHRFNVKCHGEDSPRKLDGAFDFSKVTLKRVIDLARQTVVIQYQNSVRPFPETCPTDGSEVEIMVSEAGKKTFNIESFKEKVFTKLSPEQQALLLQELQKMAAGK